MISTTDFDQKKNTTLKSIKNLICRIGELVQSQDVQNPPPRAVLRGFVTEGFWDVSLWTPHVAAPQCVCSSGSDSWWWEKARSGSQTAGMGSLRHRESQTLYRDRVAQKSQMSQYEPGLYEDVVLKPFTKGIAICLPGAEVVRLIARSRAYTPNIHLYSV